MEFGKELLENMEWYYDGRYLFLQRRESIDDRFAEIGTVLDEWFMKTVGDFKEPVPVPGLTHPGIFKSAGLRCLANVVWRE